MDQVGMIPMTRSRKKTNMVNLNDKKYLDVTCGSLFGRLHKDKFLCPGIHQECIEHEGRFVSPKAFSVMGDKVKLKDWKNAIRVNGILLRKYIDAALLDFYKHKDNCTGRCVARSPSRPLGASLGTFNELSLPSQPQHPLALVTSVGTINEHTYCHLPDDSEPDLIPAIIAAEEKSKAEEQEEFTKLRSSSGSNPSEDGDIHDRLNPLASGVRVKIEPQQVVPAQVEQQLVVPVKLTRAGLVKREPPSPSPPDINGAMDIDEETDEDTLFWRGIVQLGLVDEFFRDIKTYLDVLKHDMVKEGVEKRDANKLSAIVNELGLMTKLKFRMSQHKVVMQSQQERLDIEMEELKRKVEIAEKKKLELKRRSDCFDHLIDLTEPKRFSPMPRLSAAIANMKNNS